MKPEIKVFENSEKLAEQLALDFQEEAKKSAKENRKFLTALSGGSTPAIFFKVLARPGFKEKIPWENIHFFWGDERCVPPDHPESNFGVTKSLLFDKIVIPAANIHRVIGEAAPEAEAGRYAEELRQIAPHAENGIPRFDWIFLGLGDDGHTASLFPDAATLQEQKKLCVTAKHPKTRQTRISFTFPLINQARRISFLVTGAKKRVVVRDILTQTETGRKLPASFVLPVNGKLEWYLDQDAALLLQAGTAY